MSWTLSSNKKFNFTSLCQNLFSLSEQMLEAYWLWQCMDLKIMPQCLFWQELEDFLLLFLEILDGLMFYGYFAIYLLTIFIRKQEKKRNRGLQMKGERWKMIIVREEIFFFLIILPSHMVFIIKYCFLLFFFMFNLFNFIIWTQDCFFL